jgi:hypothetical protein
MPVQPLALASSRTLTCPRWRRKQTWRQVKRFSRVIRCSGHAGVAPCWATCGRHSNCLLTGPRPNAAAAPRPLPFLRGLWLGCTLAAGSNASFAAMTATDRRGGRAKAAARAGARSDCMQAQGLDVSVHRVTVRRRSGYGVSLTAGQRHTCPLYWCRFVCIEWGCRRQRRSLLSTGAGWWPAPAAAASRHRTSQPTPASRSRGSVAGVSALLPFYASPCSAASRWWRIALAPGFVKPPCHIASLPHTR